MSIGAADETYIVGRSARPVGITPAVLLTDPKFARNVAGALRAASCFGARQVWFTGSRVSLEHGKGADRLPREERMKGYAKVDLLQSDYPFDCFGPDVTPVAVEVLASAEPMTTFEHPERALYVFGPEDGSIPGSLRRHCHRFVVLPTDHCTNLAAAVYLTLYDRRIKRQLAGLEPVRSATDILAEQRGFIDDIPSFDE